MIYLKEDNVLHIMTPLYRFENLKKVHESIPKYSDIRWHIAKSSKREKINYIFNDSRVVVYNVNCEDADTTTKRNSVFERILDGYFCLLDDDTIFHPNMYILYRKCVEASFMGIMVGQQLFKDGSLRLKEVVVPRHGQTDSGNVLCWNSCLRDIKWPENLTWPKDPIEGKGGDGTFWRQCWVFYERQAKHHSTANRRVIDEPISYYNALR